MFHRLAPLLLCLLAFLGASPAAAQDGEVQTTWRLLDYVAVDYREAVRDGRVVNDAEYKEMSEFTSSVRERLAALPAKPAKAKLVADAAALQASVGRKAAPPEIEKQARALAAELIGAYPVPLAPRRMPDLARGSALYAENCASCHGSNGDAKTPIAATLDPPPIAFTDRERARERSLFGLYQVIDQGLEGTAMPSFRHLPDEDKWALAFTAGRFAYPAALAEQGRRIWDSDLAVRALVPDSAALTGLSESALAARIGPD
jgi:high-affinity iron transporter